ncbi:GNAT family N-acetyltransferase [Mobilitalea sibirica]|uniref:GNAT family N-acetyltransferase n=1 Tax=Mobilitalea sibirica TaxID=1462919 RepID=A0A8J7KW89_9FIRM|nr:GNAT family N-acetyltransferase [Mobilitalea sibirica]MBH1940107.1 GNAT family N-acetyltransferase [Mobilitalea sibirica]
MYEIKLATVNDLIKIYDLMNELENSKLSRVDFEMVYKENLNNNLISYFIAMDDQKIIGFISLHIQSLLHHTGRIAEIQELIVTSDYQRHGIGHLLFEKAVETAIIRGCMQLEVCCNKKRSSGHDFYQKQGMENSHYKFCMPLDK